MKKLNFEIPDLKKIEINGLTFDVLQSDADIFSKALELKNMYENLKPDDEPEKIYKAVENVISYIDKILGTGACKKITQERPLGIAKAIELMTMICQAVIEDYNESVADRYGEDE